MFLKHGSSVPAGPNSLELVELVFKYHALFQGVVHLEQVGHNFKSFQGTWPTSCPSSANVLESKATLSLYL